ncbi:MAG TPA: hypothetical protein PLO37_09160 [Candidatus Hydrogenedentes bacterium]|nr:hypothetical protein [Candidatus Hydrogenedentota bacterium]HPG66999.1 hypothetical protein [Candidatus Hydrogenedentota bacterium]
MITPYFENKLFDLLPPLYRIENLSACGHAQAGEAGDLASFLKVPAVSLDGLKELIERFPEIFDVDRCEPRYLPHGRSPDRASCSLVLRDKHHSSTCEGGTEGLQSAWCFRAW